MKNLEQAILATLFYHDLFDYPLTESEINKFLTFRLKIKDLRLKIFLKDLLQKKRIAKKNDFYFLPKRAKIVNIRKERAKQSKEKLKIAQKIAKIMPFIPWLKMIGISGALAMDNAKKDDDIDFLVITAKNRLWLTRLFIVIVLEVLGKRRKPADVIVDNKICLNMFLDETTLKLVWNRRNLFTAHEIVQMKPIFSRGYTYERFILANQWVKKYLPNALEIKKLKTKQITHYSLLITKLLDFLEQLAYQLQLKYMKSKITREQISPHFAFFHPQDKSQAVLQAFSHFRRYNNNKES